MTLDELIEALVAAREMQRDSQSNYWSTLIALNRARRKNARLREQIAELRHKLVVARNGKAKTEGKGKH